jgi:hypothetical protein
MQPTEPDKPEGAKTPKAIQIRKLDKIETTHLCGVHDS